MPLGESGGNLFYAGFGISPTGAISAPNVQSDGARTSDWLTRSLDEGAADLTSLPLPAVATLYVVRMPLLGPISITDVSVYISALSSAGLTDCYLGVWTSAGTKVGQTADLSSFWESTGGTGMTPRALSGGPYSVSPLAPNDFLWGGIYNGTSAGTEPAFFACVRSPSAPGFVNGNTAAARSRFAHVAIANTSTLPNITPSGLTPSATQFWMALS
jgi:hypothetical protein